MQAGLHSSSHVESKLYRFGNPPDSTKVRSALEARYVYDIWDPTLGTGAAAHTLLPNTTPGNTDIFCGAASLLGSGFIDGTNGSGQLLIAGGAPPVVINGVISNNNVTIFNPKNNTLTASGTMVYPRWYPP
jgi:hypothetical protein